MRQPRLAIVALIVAAALGYWIFTDSAESDGTDSRTAPGAPAGTRVTRFGPTPQATEDVTQPTPIPDADGEDRPPPISPGEEGLFAYADALGQAVVRCDVTGLAFPKGLVGHGKGHRTGDVLTVIVNANADADTPSSASWITPNDGGLNLSYSGAFSGTLGTCTATAIPSDPTPPKPLVDADGEPFVLYLEDIVVAQIAEVESETNPLQVALETPGLSEEASEWLEHWLGEDEDRLEHNLNAMEAVEARQAEEAAAPLSGQR